MTICKNRRLCTKHLKDNVKHYLQNRVGVNTTERNNIMSAIFGDDGLVSADVTATFITLFIDSALLFVHNFFVFILLFASVTKLEVLGFR
jgi:predicted dienelactone hydrolase